MRETVTDLLQWLAVLCLKARLNTGWREIAAERADGIPR